MAITYRQMIRDALVGAGVIDGNQNPSAKQANDALARLNNMLLDWQDNREIDLGFAAQTDLSANITIPDRAQRAVTLALTVIEADHYKLELPSTTVGLADNAYDSLCTASLYDGETEVVDLTASGMPLGQARRGIV